jgi:hypothetical protein
VQFSDYTTMGSDDPIRLIVLMVTAAIALLVAIDASYLGMKRGKLGGGFLDMGPVAWFFCVLFFFILSTPLYFVARHKYRKKARAEKKWDEENQPQQGPPAGWYTNKSTGKRRYWDGNFWGPWEPDA